MSIEIFKYIENNKILLYNKSDYTLYNYLYQLNNNELIELFKNLNECAVWDYFQIIGVNAIQMLWNKIFTNLGYFFYIL